MENVDLKAARELLKRLREVAKEANARVVEQRQLIKDATAVQAANAKKARDERKAKAEAAKAAALAKAEARAAKAAAAVEALRLKALSPKAIRKEQRKPGPVVNKNASLSSLGA
jgi:hypothetical protein